MSTILNLNVDEYRRMVELGEYDHLNRKNRYLGRSTTLDSNIGQSVRFIEGLTHAASR